MLINSSRLWLILGLALHGLLIGGLVITLYPKTYTAQAQFLMQNKDESAAFYSDISKLNTDKIYAEVSTTLNLTQHPLINPALAADNTKWAALNLKLRSLLNKDLLTQPPETHALKTMRRIINLSYEPQKDAALIIHVHSPSQYLSQDIANALLNTYRLYLRDQYNFKKYDPFTRTLSAHKTQNTEHKDVFLFPAGHIQEANPQPWVFLLLISTLSFMSLGLILASFSRQK